MKVSTRGRYAMRLMLDLALADPAACHSVKSIAARQQISEKYLEQIIAQLVKAGLLVSVRGAQGGYRLAKAPQDYTAGEILRVTEGPLTPVACVSAPQECPRSDGCAMQWLWGQLDEAIGGVVNHVTLEQLADIARQKNGDFVI